MLDVENATESKPTPAPNGNASRAKAVAVILGGIGVLAGNADWFTPQDVTTTRASYEITAGAIDDLSAELDADLKHQRDLLERIETRQRDYESYAAKRMRSLERQLDRVRHSVPARSRLTADQVHDDEPVSEPPPMPPPPPAPPAPAVKQLPKFEELPK